jgi:hypothetical protein
VRLRRAAVTHPLLPTVALVMTVVAATIIAIAPADDAEAATATRASASAVAGNGQHACALVSGGAAQCWTGSATDPTGAATPPTDVTFIDISASWSHSCGIVNDGTPADGGPIRCWGEAYSSAVPSDGDFIELETANSYACARDVEWYLSCWGAHGSAVQELPSTTRFSDFALGESYACGLHDGGFLLCWGLDGTNGRVSGPNGAVGERFKDVAVGTDHSCAIHEPTGALNGGELECWGRTDAVGSVPSGLFRTLEATDSGTCAIGVPSSTVSCWGWGPTSPSGVFTSIDASASGICGITADAYVDCFWSAPVTGPVVNLDQWGQRGVTLYAGVYADVPLVSYVSPAVSWVVTGVPAGVDFVNGRLQGTPTTLGGGWMTVQSVDSVFLVDESKFFADVFTGPAAGLELVVGGTGRVEGGTASLEVYLVDGVGNRKAPVTDYTATSDIAADSIAPDGITFGFDAADVQTATRTHTITVDYTLYPIGGPQQFSEQIDVPVAPLVAGLRLTLGTPGVVHSPSTVRVDGIDAQGAAVVELTDEATLASTDAADQVAADSVTPLTVGARTITASYRTLQTTAALEAGPAALDRLVVTPSSATADEGEAVTVSVEGFDAYGNTRGDYAADAVLTSDVAGDQIAGDTVTFAFAPAARATEHAVHTLTASVGALSGSSTVTVAPAARSLELRLGSSIATVGDTIVVTVVALDVHGDELGDVSSFATVTSDQAADVVTGAEVRFTHASPHVITVAYGTLTASATVEVSPAAAAAATLGATGAEPLAWLALATALIGAGVLLMRRRARA